MLDATQQAITLRLPHAAMQLLRHQFSIVSIASKAKRMISYVRWNMSTGCARLPGCMAAIYWCTESCRSSVRIFVIHYVSLHERHLARSRWTECDMAVNADFHSDFMLNYNQLLPPMLADGVRIMIYIGMQVSAGWSLSQHSSPRADSDRPTVALCAHQRQVAFRGFCRKPGRFTLSDSGCFGCGAGCSHDHVFASATTDGPRPFHLVEIEMAVGHRLTVLSTFPQDSSVLQDFICNEVGNRWWVEALEWERAADWNAAPREDWEVDGEKAGTSQVAEPLTFVTVDDAGHMVRFRFGVSP